jgi:hypothetical protein
MTQEGTTVQTGGAGRPPDMTARMGLWLTFAALIVIPGISFVHQTFERMDRVETQLREVQLPLLNDRLTRIERDVDWIRKEIERKK